MRQGGQQTERRGSDRLKDPDAELVPLMRLEERNFGETWCRGRPSRPRSDNWHAPGGPLGLLAGVIAYVAFG